MAHHNSIRTSKSGNSLVTGQVTSHPRRKDILCGKGKLCVGHIGSRLFRAVIESYRHRYSLTKSKYEKMMITKAIYERFAHESCRFLKFNDSTMVWEELSAMAARDKVGHALRFANRSKRRKTKNSECPATVDSLLAEFPLDERPSSLSIMGSAILSIPQATPKEQELSLSIGLHPATEPPEKNDQICSRSPRTSNPLVVSVLHNMRPPCDKDHQGAKWKHMSADAIGFRDSRRHSTSVWRRVSLPDGPPQSICAQESQSPFQGTTLSPSEAIGPFPLDESSCFVPIPALAGDSPLEVPLKAQHLTPRPHCEVFTSGTAMDDLEPTPFSIDSTGDGDATGATGGEHWWSMLQDTIAEWDMGSLVAA